MEPAEHYICFYTSILARIFAYNCGVMIVTKLQERRRLLALILLALLAFAGHTKAENIMIDHSSVAMFDTIELSNIPAILSEYHIYYGRASHGRQIHTGLDMVEAENSAFGQLSFHPVDVYVDQDGTGDTMWVPDIRSYLNATPS